MTMLRQSNIKIQMSRKFIIEDNSYKNKYEFNVTLANGNEYKVIQLFEDF